MFYFLIFVFVILALILVLEYVFLMHQYKKSDYYRQSGISYWKVRSDAGMLGEYLIYDRLRKLKGYKKWIFNCYIPKDNGETTELDVILLHESGIYLFESKNYSGWIFGTETQQYWTQTLPKGRGRSEKNRFFNPIIQNKVHLKWIQNYLGNLSWPIYSYIVFSERCTLKDINLTSNQHFVINRYDILPAVRKTAKKAEIWLTPGDIDALYEKLYPLTQLSEAEKKQHIENIKRKHSVKKTDISQEQNTAQSEQSALADQEQESTEQTASFPEQENNSENQTVSLEETQSEQSDAIKEQTTDHLDEVEKICPRCGWKLILRTSSRGAHKGNQFWGCTNYPKCRFIENIGMPNK